MKRLLLTILVLAGTVSSASAIIEGEPDHSILWNNFSSVCLVDSFAVATTSEGLVVMQYDPAFQTYDIVSHLFLESEPISQKRTNEVITVRSTTDLLYFIDISNLPNLTALGTADFGFPIHDFALFGQDIYVAAGFDGLLRYTMVNWESLTLADWSLVGIHYTQVEIYGTDLYALDDYNGLLHYQLTGIGFGNYIETLWIPRRTSTFTKTDAGFAMAVNEPRLFLADKDEPTPVITDTVDLLFAPTQILTVDSFVVALNSEFDVAELISLNTMERYQFILDEPLDEALQGYTFGFDGENSLMVPTAGGGLALYKLDNIHLDPSPVPVFNRPGPIVDIDMVNSKLYTAGLGNPLDVYDIDSIGTPRLRETVYEGLTHVEAMHRDGDLLATYYPSLSGVVVSNISYNPVRFNLSVYLDMNNVGGIVYSDEKIDTLRSLYAFNSDFVYGFAISDSGYATPAFDVSVVDRALDIAIMDTVLFIATGKGRVHRYRIYNDFSLGWRDPLSLPTDANDLLTHGDTLMAFVENKMVIFDFTDTAIDGEKTTVTLPFEVESGVVDGDRLVGVGRNGFILVDISHGIPAVIDYGTRGGHLVAAENGIVAISNGNVIHIYDTRDVVTGVVDDPTILPQQYTLSQNYPNPFNPSTVISYSLPERTQVSVDIYNILGRKVKSLINEEQPAGSYEVLWNGEDSSGDRVASGVYLYRLVTERFTQSKKMVLLK